MGPRFPALVLALGKPRCAAFWERAFSFLFVWTGFIAATLLLSWCVTVLNDVMYRGEQRPLQQVQGALVVAGEVAMLSVGGAREPGGDAQAR